MAVKLFEKGMTVEVKCFSCKRHYSMTPLTDLELNYWEQVCPSCISFRFFEEKTDTEWQKWLAEVAVMRKEDLEGEV